MFLAEGQDEARAFLVLLHDLLIQDAPAIIAVFTIRSDNYERLQLAKELEGLRQETLSLPPMPKGSYAEVIKGPARRLEGTERPLEVEDALVNTLLTDIEAGGAKDALPLLAFTLERLYVEHGGDGDLTVAEYRSLGGITGSIEAAVERALKAADADPAIPKDRAARLALLRRGLIPWLAGIDPDTGAPRRRVARLSEIPAEARPLIQHLVEQRLLADRCQQGHRRGHHRAGARGAVAAMGPVAGLAHRRCRAACRAGRRQARQPRLGGEQPRPRLACARRPIGWPRRSGFRRGPTSPPTWSRRIATTSPPAARPRRTRRRGKRLLQAVIYVLLVGVIVGLIGWINQSYHRGSVALLDRDMAV